MAAEYKQEVPWLIIIWMCRHALFFTYLQTMFQVQMYLKIVITDLGLYSITEYNNNLGFTNDT